LNIYIAPLRDSEALPTEVSAIASKQDSLQAFSKKGRGRVRSSRSSCWGRSFQLEGPTKAKFLDWAVALRNYVGDNQKASGSRAEGRSTRKRRDRNAPNFSESEGIKKLTRPESCG